MPVHKFSLRYTLLAAALIQIMPVAAHAAKAVYGIHRCEDCPYYPGWSGWVEGGVGYQSEDDYHLGRFNGYHRQGGLANASGDVGYRAKNGTYADVKALDLGLDSRDLLLDGGKQGKYGISLEYHQIPNFRVGDAYTPFHDHGGNLTLPSNWVRGATSGSMPSLPSDLAQTTLKTVRDRTKIKFNYIPSRPWEITGYYQHEYKHGTQDIGAGFGFGSVSILPGPIHYRTDDFGLALGYMSRKLQGRLAYTGSLFRDSLDSITFENPYSTPAGAAAGQISTPPDNQFHKISGLIGYQVTDHTRVGGQLAFGRMTQNASYVAVPLAGTLPKNSLDGRVDTTLAKLEVNSRPMPRLQLNGSYTYSNRDNKTDVNAYDYIITDVYQATNPNTGAMIHRRNTPYSFKQRLLLTKAAYILPKGAILSGGFDYNQMNRSYMQVKETRDNTFWAKIRMHPTEKLETSLKYSYSARDASRFLNDPSLENPLYPNNPLMEAFYLADRHRDKVGIKFSYNPKDSLSLGFDLDYYKDDYHNMVLGLTQATGLTGTPTLTYVFSDRLSGTLYYTYDRLRSAQASQAWIATPAVNTPWMESDSNLTQTTGLSLSWKAIPKKLDVGADLVYTDFTGKMHYANTADLPDLKSRMTALGLHGNYKLKKDLSLRVGYWYEKYNQTDWAQSGSTSNVPTLLSLGTSPLNTNMYVMTASLRYTLK